MTVKELIAKLNELDPDLQVMVDVCVEPGFYDIRSKYKQYTRVDAHIVNDRAILEVR